MTRPILQALIVLCLVTGLDVAAQPERLERLTPWKPQRHSVWYFKDRSNQSPPTLLVASGVATTLVFASDEVDSAEFAGEVGKRFADPEVGKHSVVIIPKRDLAEGEHISFTVTLRDGAVVPFDLVSTPSNRGSHGQVDVLLEQENVEECQLSLQAARDQVEALTFEVARRSAEEVSVDVALATLLAQGKEEFTPFIELDRRTLQNGPAAVRLMTYKRRSSKIDLGRAALVFDITNNGPTSWELDEVRLAANEPYNSSQRPFALRASTRVIAPGKAGRFALVIRVEALRASPVANQYVVELWRAGVPQPDRVAAVELVAVRDSGAPLQLAPRRPAQ